MNKFQQSTLTTVVNDIMDAEYKHIQRQVDELVDKNKELLGPGTDDGFIYMEQWYARTGMVGRPNQGLHPDLYSTMQRIAAFTKVLDDDKKIITQVLGKLVVACDTLEEMRNELPECVISLHPPMWRNSYTQIPYPRTRTAAQSIQNNPRELRQYEKILTKIGAYCAMRFLL